jgi:hypothetical protein
MSVFRIRTIYVESIGDRESFAWRDGHPLDDGDREREQIHRELANLAARAEFDKATEWGRVLRCGDRLVVELLLDPLEHVPHRLTATVVVAVSFPRRDTDWVASAAEEVAAALRNEGLTISLERLKKALAWGWRRRSPFGGSRRRVAALAAAVATFAAWLARRKASRSRCRANDTQATRSTMAVAGATMSTARKD